MSFYDINGKRELSALGEGTVNGICFDCNTALPWLGNLAHVEFCVVAVRLLPKLTCSQIVCVCM